MSQPVHACYELSGAFWIVVPQGFSEWLGIFVCSGNYNSPSCTGCSRKQAQTLAVSWGRSENKGEIQELAFSLTSNMSSRVVWLLAYFKDGHLGSGGLKVQSLLTARKDFILSWMLPVCLCRGTLPCGRLWIVTFKLLKCPLKSWQTLAVVFTTPTQHHASWSMNIDVFSQLLNPCTPVFPDIRIHL